MEKKVHIAFLFEHNIAFCCIQLTCNEVSSRGALESRLPLIAFWTIFPLDPALWTSFNIVIGTLS